MAGLEVYSTQVESFLRKYIPMHFDEPWWNFAIPMLVYAYKQGRFNRSISYDEYLVYIMLEFAKFILCVAEHLSTMFLILFYTFL